MKRLWNQPKTAGRDGFTLVELTAGMVTASVLALTAGSMLWYGYLGWHRLGDAVNMQRDMRAALETLSHAVRTGTNMTVTGGTVFTVQSATRPPVSVYSSGGSLYYDPNTGAAGDQITLVNGTLQTFDVAVASNTATALLVLKSNSETLSNRVVMTRRN